MSKGLQRFLESEEGKNACNPKTLGTSEEAGEYLKNRIINAFEAGEIAARRKIRLAIEGPYVENFIRITDE